jgi:radical SAM superfamily enzyme YgiQ (UPF0313 family)
MSVQKDNFRIVLISTYELGRQPFGLASPAAWLRKEGFRVTTTDVAVEPFPTQAVNQANLVAFYVPMHTATRLASEMIKRIKEINPNAHLCCYGLYAPVNENYLGELGVDTILGGEFEEGLVNLCRRLSANGKPNLSAGQLEPRVSLSRLKFQKPDRNDLPDLFNYAKLCWENSISKVTGYVEASRGCKHYCRHCPIVPVYNGKFRIVQKEIVLQDIRQQVEVGAGHITFGDPDFFNGPGHAIPIVRSLHQEFPGVTYDVTIKIEHLLKHQDLLPILKETGCAIVTSAVESIDDHILEIFDKRHNREDFVRIVQIFDEIGLNLNPTFVTFTPWTTLHGYKELLTVLNDLNLIWNVSPVQLAIRLLIPDGSKLFEHPETKKVLGKFDQENLSYEWANPDPRVERLFRDVRKIIHSGQQAGKSRHEIFLRIWNCTNGCLNQDEPLPKPRNDIKRSTIPYLNESWYC